MAKSNIGIMIALAAAAAFAFAAGSADAAEERDPRMDPPEKPPGSIPTRPRGTDDDGRDFDPFSQDYSLEDLSDEEDFPPGLWDDYQDALESENPDFIFSVAERLFDAELYPEGVIVYLYGEEIHQAQSDRFHSFDQLVELANTAFENGDFATVEEVANKLDALGFPEEAQQYRDAMGGAGEPDEEPEPTPDQAQQLDTLIAQFEQAMAQGDYATASARANQVQQLGFGSSANTMRAEIQQAQAEAA